MRRIVWNQATASQRADALARPDLRADPAMRRRVTAMLDAVAEGGWDAVATLARTIDGAAPERVSVAPIAAQARAELDAEAVAAIELAASNIRTFHEASRPQDIAVETMPGLTVRKLWRAIPRVGLYVPGGVTPLFSSLLMQALPARAARVEELIVVTPPRKDGGLDPALALAAELCGIDAVWTLGGAQAVAAMAFGAGEIPACDKVCGPGNAWVAEAKAQIAARGIAIDLPAGPSELMVIADAGANPRVVAADLLGQAEHDAHAQVLLATDSAELAQMVEAEVERLLEELPRADQARAAIDNSRIVLVETLADAVGIANDYAPEHLSLAVAAPDALIDDIVNAGAVFVGYQGAESFGDYCAGSSHVLPTDRAARAWGGISTHTFMKAISVQHITPERAAALAAPTAAMARLEGLEAHARSAEMRGNV
ncbi:histidinol dehydrogenase [Pseudoblastomonas halimionae]|uniref:Histidinol dehydrogenase n=1 Tax=Alteriqipengyuania halimionae TaxID=1926630 RepID=A0A6I4U6U9_9SPHN|nr:histidinol dehydrogenase [Alteriqipengyuania halimionae]MXP10555.1 histidinol dehydrogenase [Alteriqipengyuania halimionae]